MNILNGERRSDLTHIVFRAAIAGGIALNLASCADEPKKERSLQVKKVDPVCDEEMTVNDSSSVVVDGRCGMNGNRPVAVYKYPNSIGVPVTSLETGTVIQDACTVPGEPTTDGAGVTSIDWIQFDEHQSATAEVAQNIKGPYYVAAVSVQDEQKLSAC